ncbi:MAG: hypothetical protein JF595_11485 [Sphingomonadales bacterium]|nr:hypothetical protein [Sphingomonadales bacterium]
MFRKSLIAPLLAASAIALTVSPAHAGKADRAREAIAAAEAKIHTAETLGATTEMPREAAQARASLALAKDKLARGAKSDSIEEAIHAQALADTAIGVMQRRQNEAVADAQAARSEDVAVAQQQAASAQDQAADANARAAAAERAAAASAAQAEAARVAAQTPAQVETTVTTQQPAPRRAARTVTRKTTTTTARRTTAPAPTTTTTTTVKQAVN